MAYTQSSRWQLCKTELSKAFQETNYEPEAFVVRPAKYRFQGLNGKFGALLGEPSEQRTRRTVEPKLEPHCRADRFGAWPVHTAAPPLAAHPGGRIRGR